MSNGIFGRLCIFMGDLDDTICSRSLLTDDSISFIYRLDKPLQCIGIACQKSRSCVDSTAGDSQRNFSEKHFESFQFHYAGMRLFQDCAVNLACLKGSNCRSSGKNYQVKFSACPSCCFGYANYRFTSWRYPANVLPIQISQCFNG